MKAKITKKDGTAIELEGTVEEIARIVDPPILPPLSVKPAVPPAPTDFGKMLEELQKAAKDQQHQPHQPWAPLPWITQPQIIWNDGCPMGGAHDFPSIWMSVGPASCSKCGKQSAPNTFVTITSTLCQTNEGFSNSTRLPFISAFTVVNSESQS